MQQLRVRAHGGHAAVHDHNAIRADDGGKAVAITTSVVLTRRLIDS
ncbi:MAG: hypothetical protein ACLTTU_10400 [Bilophila wadsworthia]